MKPLRRHSGKAASGFIYITAFLDVLAGSMILPVLPRFLAAVTNSGPAVISETLGALMGTFALLQMIAGPVQGALSDRFGRRPIILASSMGMTIDFALTAAAPSVPWLFVARVFGGLMAGSAGAAYAYMMDVSEPASLPKRLGFLGAAAMAGAALGPSIGGWLGQTDPRLPYWCGAALAAVGTLYGLLVLPESLPRDRRKKIAVRLLHPLGVLWSLWKSCPALVWWHISVLLFAVAIAGVNSIFSLYVTFRFAWTPSDIGTYGTVVAIATIVVQAGLVGRFTRWFGEWMTLLVATVLQVASNIGAGFAGNGLEFTGFILIMVLGGVAGPVQLTLMNRNVAPDERGSLSGATNSIFGLAGVAGPLVFAPLLGWTSARYNGNLAAGTPFFAATLLIACAGSIATYMARSGDKQVLTSPESAG